MCGSPDNCQGDRAWQIGRIDYSRYRVDWTFRKAAPGSGQQTVTTETSCAVSGPHGVDLQGLRIHVGAQILAIERIPYYDVPRSESPCFCNVWSHIHCINLLGFRPFLCLSYGTAVLFNNISQRLNDSFPRLSTTIAVLIVLPQSKASCRTS